MNNAFYAQELSDEQLEMVVGAGSKSARALALSNTNIQLNIAVAPQVNVVLFSDLYYSSVGGAVNINQQNDANAFFHIH